MMRQDNSRPSGMWLIEGPPRVPDARFSAALTLCIPSMFILPEGPGTLASRTLLA